MMTSTAVSISETPAAEGGGMSRVLARFTDEQIAAARDGIEKFLNARGHALKRQRNYLVGPCPVCGGDDRFTVNLKKRAFYCRGCSKGGDAIELAMHVTGASFADAVRLLADIPELPPLERAKSPRKANGSDTRSSIERWWREARPIEGTLAERYLQGRGIVTLPDQHNDCLRFHPHMVFGQEGDAWRFAPCLVALVRDVDSNSIIGLQRVGLTASGDKLDRMALGNTWGGAVKLDADAEVTMGLCIAEGLETALAARCIEHRGTSLRPMWSALHAGNMQRFPVLPGIDALTIVADNDENGRGQDAAAACAETWRAAGREVIRLTPRGLSS